MFKHREKKFLKKSDFRMIYEVMGKRKVEILLFD